MEVLLRKKKTEDEDEISHLQKSIQRITDSIERLRKTNSKIGFNPVSMIANNLNELSALEARLLEQEQILISIENGTYDDIFKKEIQCACKQKVVTKRKKKISKKHYSPSNHSIQYETKRYFRDCQSIPDYIEAKLDNMPEDKGYIWKDIWCFGRLPRERDQMLTLFEKKYNHTYIHVYDKKQNKYSLYEKNFESGQKVLIDEYPLK